MAAPARRVVYNLSREANSTPSCVKPYRISPARYGKPIHFLRDHSVSRLHGRLEIYLRELKGQEKKHAQMKN